MSSLLTSTLMDQIATVSTDSLLGCVLFLRPQETLFSYQAVQGLNYSVIDGGALLRSLK